MKKLAFLIFPLALFTSEQGWSKTTKLPLVCANCYWPQVTCLTANADTYSVNGCDNGAQFMGLRWTTQYSNCSDIGGIPISESELPHIASSAAIAAFYVNTQCEFGQK